MCEECKSHVVRTAKVRLRNGRVIYARSYGKKCFTFVTHKLNCPLRSSSK